MHIRGGEVCGMHKQVIAKRFFDGILVPMPLIALFAPMWSVPVLGLFALLAMARFWPCLPRIFFAMTTVDRRWIAVLAAAMCWPLITVLWSLDPVESLSAGLRFWLMIGMGWVAFGGAASHEAISDKTLRIMALALAGGGAILAMELLPQGGLIRLLSLESAAGNYERFMAKTINRGLCAMAVLLWPIAAALWWRYGRGVALCAGLPIVLAIGGLESASAQLALLGGGAILLASRYSSPLAWLGMRMMPVILLLLPVVVWGMAEFSLFSAHQESLNALAARRPLIWEQLVHLLRGHAWLGFGMDTSPLLPFSQEALAVMFLEEPPLHPHCTPLQWVAELGLVGLLLGCLLVAWALRGIERACAPDAWLLAVARATSVAYVLAGLFAFGVWQHWWLAMAWLAALLVRRLHAGAS